MDDFQLKPEGKDHACTIFVLGSYQNLPGGKLYIFSCLVYYQLNNSSLSFNRNEETAVETAAVLILKGKCKRNPSKIIINIVCVFMCLRANQLGLTKSLCQTFDELIEEIRTVLSPAVQN